MDRLGWSILFMLTVDVFAMRFYRLDEAIKPLKK